MTTKTKEDVLLLMREKDVGLFRHYDIKRRGWFTVAQSKVRDDAYLDYDYIYQCVVNHTSGRNST